jgi:hypothetical protein
MRTVLLLCLILTILLPTRSAELSEDAWDQALSAVRLTRETCRFDMLDMAQLGGGDYALPYFNAMHQEPLRIPAYLRAYRQEALGTAGSVGEMVMRGGLRIKEGTYRKLLGDPNREEAQRASGVDSLVSAVRAVHVAGGSPLNPAQVNRLMAAAKAVPPDVAQNAAFLLFVELKAIRWRNRALAGMAGHNLGQLFNKLTTCYRDDDSSLDEEVEKLRRQLDMKALLVGAGDLAAAVDTAVAALAKRTGQERFVFDWDTPLGRIGLRGSGSDAYAGDRPYLLIIDTGGNDSFAGGGATFSASHPMSVLIDLAGDDRYLERPELGSSAVAQFPDRKAISPRPSFGAGTLGYGYLVDVAGNDLNRSLSNTQGRGLFGVGVLQDRGGNDRYDCYTLGQGSADNGVGALADLGGADEYRCFQMSQGYGGTKGSGLLVDTGNDSDLYEANNSVLDFPSPQTQNGNVSLAQGAGNGRRADYLDGHSMAGGVGGLVDEGGKNSFSCGVFGQGTGYWYGAGLLCTGAGDDTYSGLWYVQGASAHYAVGALYDEGGNDRYRATMNMAQGAGHDYGPGFLVDYAGNDRYEAPNLSLGGGNANGMGFFWDRQGDDTYLVSPSVTLGRAAPNPNARGVRERNLTLGVFLDTGGSDVYPSEIAYAQNNALWTMHEAAPPPLPKTRGVGLDIESPATPEPQ